MTARFRSGIGSWVKQRYPLEALKVLREVSADRCSQHLAAAERRSSVAAAELARAQENLKNARATNAAVARRTREELEAGRTRVAELLQARAFARAAAASEQSLARTEGVLQQRLEDAVLSRKAAQLALGAARSELSALERHQGEWRMARVREGETREEEAALERWNAERFGLGRR